MIKKCWILLLCLMIAVTFTPLYAFAEVTDAGGADPGMIETEDAAELEAPAEAETIPETETPAITEDGDTETFSLMDEDYDPWTAQDTVEKMSELMETGFDPGETIGWGVAQLLPFVFGTNGQSQSEKTMEMLNQIIANQEIIKDKLNKIDERLVKQEVADHLNDYLFGANQGAALHTYYLSLNDIDTRQYTEKEKEEARINLLAYSMPDKKDEVSDHVYDFDVAALSMGKTITEGFFVSYMGARDNLFGLFHMWCKYQYHWEHQAYADWINFRNIVYMQYLSAAMVDKLSLQARIKVMNDEKHNHFNLDNQLKLLEKQMDEVNAIFKSEDEWTGIVKKRSDNVRYYWYPGNEKEIYTKALQNKVPWEADHKHVGIKQSSKLKGVSYAGGLLHMHVVYSFWRPFTSYTLSTNSDGSANYRKCPTVEWYQQVLKDYNNKKNLYQIFFDENEGNMKAPKGSSSDWKFVADPAKGHEMSLYWGGLIYPDAVVTPVVRANGAEIKDARNGKGTDIYWYHDGSTEVHPAIVKKNYPYIGIGVVDAYLAPDPNEATGIISKAIPEKITLKASASKKGFTLSWKKAEKARKYEVFQKKIGAKSFKKIKTITNPAKNTLLIKKNKLAKKKGYIYYVKVTGVVNGKTVSMNTWKAVVYPTNGKYTNVKSLSLAKGIGTSLTLKKGKTKILGAKAAKVKKSKKLPKTYKAVRYASSNTKVAAVSAKGVITAKAAGTCYVYAYGTNGVCKAIKVTVK